MRMFVPDVDQVPASVTVIEGIENVQVQDEEPTQRPEISAGFIAAACCRARSTFANVIPCVVRHEAGIVSLTVAEIISVTEYVMSALKAALPVTRRPDVLTVAPGHSAMISMFIDAVLTHSPTMLQLPTTSPPHGWTLPQLASALLPQLDRNGATATENKTPRKPLCVCVMPDSVGRLR